MNESAVENVTWTISEGRLGVINQVRGLAEAIGLPVEVKTVRPRWPWTMLRVTLWPAPLAALGADSARIGPPWPRVVVGCGWRAIPYVLEVKRRSGGRTFTVQLQHPRVNPKRFDLVVPPEHDNLNGANVVPIVGSPNRVTKATLDEAAARWASHFERLPRPRVAILVGGASKSHRFDDEDARRLAERLKVLAVQGYGVMATTSPRTGETQSRIVREALAGPNAFVWDASRGSPPDENPLMGMLALADAIVVTSDSTNMPVEAAATGKPVYIVDIPGGRPKFGRLHESLKARGIARAFEGKIETWTYAPLNETARVADLIRAKIGLRR